MDFRYFDAFLLAVNSPTLAAAARSLKIAPSALTRQIKLFEESVGLELFERKNRQCIPTKKALEIALLGEKFRLNCSETVGKAEVFNLKIGSLEGALHSLLLPYLQKIKLPELLNLDIRLGSTPDLLENILSNKIHAALASEKVDSNLTVCKVLANDELVLVSSKPIDLHELHLERWIYVFEGSYLNKLSKKPPLQTIRVESLRAVLDLVQSNMGIAVLPLKLIPKKSNLKLTPLPKLAGSKIYLIHSKQIPEIARVFLSNFVNFTSNY
jgi:DNA-binding transcriptional LysR family regulator